MNGSDPKGRIGGTPESSHDEARPRLASAREELLSFFKPLLFSLELADLQIELGLQLVAGFFLLRPAMGKHLRQDGQ
jgi:hypothetical protein